MHYPNKMKGLLHRLFHRRNSNNPKASSSSHDLTTAPPASTRNAQNDGQKSDATVTKRADDSTEEIWKAANNPDANPTKFEKVVDQTENRVDAAISPALKTTVSVVKAVAENPVVQDFGKVILGGIPVLMNALEELSKVHPFVSVAFLPFKFAYSQELKRRDNDKIRLSLFETIKDVMMVVIETKNLGVEPQDERKTPDGEPLVTRLAALGQKMRDDIMECYNALDAMQKQSLIVKFCKAGAWNDRLATYQAKFKVRRTDLQFALALSTALTIQDMNTNGVQNDKDRLIDTFLQANGGAGSVMSDDVKCGALIKLQNDLTTTHNIQSTYAAGPGLYKARSGGDPTTELALKNQIAALRKEYCSDVATVIQENMQTFLNHLDLSLHLLSEDLKANVRQEVDRVIDYMKDGPYQQLRSKGWHGTAKTRTLVLVLRDYLLEQNERTVNRATNATQRPSSPSLSATEGAQSQIPENALDTPLSDKWMVDYLQVKRLRKLQQALDPDISGFSTIAEVNAFTQRRQNGWSLPRWVSYWAIGWQIYATQYCTEIDNIFRQITFIRAKVGIRMPGNKKRRGLSSSASRAASSGSRTAWLKNKFQDYVYGQEEMLESRLKRIRYVIDSSEMVNELLKGEPLEHSILALLAVIMRSHLDKMHLALTEELNAKELFDDAYTIKFVVEAAWLRYQGLTDYHAWDDWTSEKYYKNNPVVSNNTVPQFVPKRPQDLRGPLLHEVPNGFSEHSSDQEQAIRHVSGSCIAPSRVLIVSSATRTICITSRHASTGRHSNQSSSGVWFGFHSTDEASPSSGMFNLNIKASPSGDTKLLIKGTGVGIDRLPTTIQGTVAARPTPVADEISGYGDYAYEGTLDSERQVLHGTFKTLRGGPTGGGTGAFFMKKTPRADIMCFRPLRPRLNARELWHFAYNVEVAKMRKSAPSLQYILTRLRMLRRTLKLLCQHVAQPAPGELACLRQAFTVTQWTDIIELSTWYDHVGDLQPVHCLECEPTSSTIDLDAKETCVRSSTKPRDTLPIPHKPTHLLLKTRDMLLLKNYYSIKKKAIICATLAAELYREGTENGSKDVDDAVPQIPPTLPRLPSAPSQSFDSKSPPTAPVAGTTANPDTSASAVEITLKCLICARRVSAPCWYCLDCRNCETEIDGLHPWDYQRRYRNEAACPDAHNVFHVLIRL
ncbi:hypothetical protein FB451DRAFT_1185458 [Mycena latifolia]|nr:hypothetical protein FB451DRAFT_1185458 [Mycena latifolia]